MPIVGNGTDVFWNTTDILNFARVLANDTQGGLSGQDLADDRPYTWTLLNLCYAKMANWLEDANVESATYAEAVLTMPASPSTSDPNATSGLYYSGFIDTSGNQYDLPALPTDLLEPLIVWIRNTGQGPFYELPQRMGGLNPTFYSNSFRAWEFRENTIYLAGGSSQETEMRIRYIRSLPVLVQPTKDHPDPPIIPFARAGEALAYMVAAEFAEIRNAPNAGMLRAKANEQLAIIANKSAKRSNQSQTRRQGYGFNRRRAWR